MEGCNVAVIGGGPAGVLCAAHFAKQGANVTVYERRTLAQQQDPGIGWSIALGGVACKALEDAGLSSDFGPQHKCVSCFYLPLISSVNMMLAVL
jgi:2-polyprenyl-6-methoxyphenol hydroxylase-like FAD-dependent oxidoreductase